MSNVLSEEKRQQVIALGRLGWPLRRIEQETGVRRETAGAYLKAAGIGVRPPGAWGRRPPEKPANQLTTGSDDGARTATRSCGKSLHRNSARPTAASPSTALITALFPLIRPHTIDLPHDSLSPLNRSGYERLRPWAGAAVKQIVRRLQVPRH